MRVLPALLVALLAAPVASAIVTSGPVPPNGALPSFAPYIVTPDNLFAQCVDEGNVGVGWNIACLYLAKGTTLSMTLHDANPSPIHTTYTIAGNGMVIARGELCGSTSIPMPAGAVEVYVKLYDTTTCDGQTPGALGGALEVQVS
jgi:hypothetical protein